MALLFLYVYISFREFFRFLLIIIISSVRFFSRLPLKSPTKTAVAYCVQSNLSGGGGGVAWNEFFNFITRHVKRKHT